MDPKKIAKKAMTKAFDNNCEAIVLYYTLANIGGNFGLIIRREIEEIMEIELNAEDPFFFLDWLPIKLKEEFVALAQEKLVKATFITNNKPKSMYDNTHWHIVANATIKTIIESKARKWAAQNKEWMNQNDNRNDSVTTIHFL